MPSNIALIVCFFCIAVLFRWDRRWRPALSSGLWIPLIWVLIIGSRPVSFWFSSSAAVDGGADYLDGSPADRLIYQILIFAGLLVLLSRKVNWWEFCTRNKWLVAYFAYFGISVLWSDYTFISFKRWVKEFGNLVMVLIVLSEVDPGQAVKAVMLRCSYVLVPLSVVFIKYFPDLGRYYDRWTGHAYYCGVTTNKNLLGMTVATCAVCLLWALIERLDEPERKDRRKQILVYALLLGMAGWLLVKADSATAVLCSAIAAAILLIFRYECFRKNAVALALTVGVGTGLFAALDSIWSIRDVMTGILGRDSSFTGRTDIWNAVLSEKTNPIVGTGFYSFWIGERAERLSQAYHYLLNEAHNGYLEIYLNGGFIGLSIFVLMVWSALVKCLVRLNNGINGSGNGFGIAFLLLGVVYCLSEAIVGRLNLIWFGLLLVMANYPGSSAETPKVSGITYNPQTSRPRANVA